MGSIISSLRVNVLMAIVVNFFSLRVVLFQAILLVASIIFVLGITVRVFRVLDEMGSGIYEQNF